MQKDQKKLYLRVFIPNELIGCCRAFPACLCHVPSKTQLNDIGASFLYFVDENAPVKAVNGSVEVLQGYGYTVTLEMM